MEFILIALYLTPAFIALVRGHASKWGILVCNIIFGWTMIVWFWCLIWALSNKGASQTVIVNNHVGDNK